MPNQANNFRSEVTGTSSVILFWDKVSGNENLRGETATYFLIFENGAVNTSLTSHTLTNSELLIRGAQQTVQVRNIWTLLGVKLEPSGRELTDTVVALRVDN